MGIRTRSQRRRRKVAKSQEPADLISRLPDGVLEEIITLLPTKDGGRTQILSSRWRHLWRSAPLNLDVADLFGEVAIYYGQIIYDDDARSGLDDARVGIISRILSAHRGPARRVHLRWIPSRHRRAVFDGWFRSPALSDLQELDFRYFMEPMDMTMRYRRGMSVLRFAPTLRVASLGCFRFPDEVVPSLNFPQLKQLTLANVTISEHAIHSLLSGCPVLESLLLDWITGIRCLRIRSFTLRSIGAFPRSPKHENRIQELVIDDAPSLERLIQLDPVGGPLVVRLISAPNLKILGPISFRICKLQIGTTAFQEMLHSRSTVSMLSVKILALYPDVPDLSSVVSVLTCFPCLEKLYIMDSPITTFKHEWLYDPVHPIECLKFHLRKVVFQEYRGTLSEVSIGKFFVLHASVLEAMEFGIRLKYNCNYGDRKWEADQRELLELDNRAARDAQFNFKSYYDIHTLSFNRHTHDLSIADPFDGSTCNCCRDHDRLYAG